jgi:hypothetical protein
MVNTRRLISLLKPSRSHLMRTGRFFAKLLIWCVVLAGLLAGAGFGYVWWSGQQETPVLPQATLAPNRPTFSKPKPSPNAPVSASVQSITSPVSPGEDVSMTVRTTPEAACEIFVEYDNDVKSTAAGLQPATADEFGMVTWEWTVEPTAPIGIWDAEVNCAAREKSAMVRGELEIKR